MYKLTFFFMLIFFFISCSTTPSGNVTVFEKKDRKPDILSNAPSWVSKIQFIEGDTHYFTGRSSGSGDEGEGHEKALRDALHQVSRYIRVELKSLSKSYEEMTSGEVSEMVTAVSSEKGAFITLKEYFRDYYSEPRYDGGSIVFDCYVKIGISLPEMEKIKIQAADITGWSIQSDKNCSFAKDDAINFFKEISSHLGWKLSEKPSENINDSSHSFFVQGYFSCKNNEILFRLSRNSLIEKNIVQTVSSKATDLTELKTNLFKTLGITLTKIDFPEYNSINNRGALENIDSKLAVLYNSALEYDKKGRLFPEKALNSWTQLVNYNGNNPFKETATEKISFYKNFNNMENDLKTLNNSDKLKLEQILKLSSLPKKDLSQIFLNYFETYGAYSGEKTIQELINLITPSEKKESVKKMVFENNLKNELWEQSCSNGDGAKCYLMSFGNVAQSREYKKQACILNVKTACSELAEEAVAAKQGQNALFFGQKACHLGDQDWCFKAGKIFYSGENGVKIDVLKAFPLLSDSCEINDVRGCFFIGFMYEKGEGVKQDKEKANNFYKKSCDLGFKDSCNKIKE